MDLDFGFGLYPRPCSEHACYIETGISLLTGHDALLLRQIARSLLHACKQQSMSYRPCGVLDGALYHALLFRDEPRFQGEVEHIAPQRQLSE